MKYLLLLVALLGCITAGLIEAGASPPDQPPLFDPATQDYTLFTGPRTSPVTMYYDPSHELWPVPDSLIVQALTEWNEVTPNFRYVYGGRLTLGSAYGNNLCGSSPPNGVNSISWWQIAGGGVLARSCVWQSAQECDIELATDQPAYMTVPEDFRTILLHESGHCAGLGHSQDRTAVMYAAFLGPNHIQPDDAAGICFLYGGPCTVPQPPTPTPTSTHTAVPTRTPTRTPTPTPTLPRRAVGANVARD